MGQWLTPDSYATRHGVAIFIPDQRDAHALITGVLSELALAYNWEQSGDLTEVEAAAVWAVVLDDWMAHRGRVMEVGDIFLAGYDASSAAILACDGASLLRSEYDVLFSVIGTAYGSSDGDHFNVPDLRGRTPIGSGQGSGLTNRSRGQSGGAETVALSIAQMPQHRHSRPAKDGPQNTDPTYSSNGNGNITANQYTDYQGSGQAHPNMQPWQCVSYFIVAE